MLGLLEESLKRKGKLFSCSACITQLFIAGYLIVISLFHHKCSHIGGVERPGAQLAEFVTSPLDITGFEATALLYFRELLRQ